MANVDDYMMRILEVIQSEGAKDLDSLCFKITGTWGRPFRPLVEKALRGLRRMGMIHPMRHPDMDFLTIWALGTMEACRCGWDGKGHHPCHGFAYTCRQPSTQRFYDPQPVGLAGVQMKLQVKDTWSCDPCWERFQVELAANKKIDK